MIRRSRAKLKQVPKTRVEAKCHRILLAGFERNSAPPFGFGLHGAAMIQDWLTTAEQLSRRMPTIHTSLLADLRDVTRR